MPYSDTHNFESNIVLIEMCQRGGEDISFCAFLAKTKNMVRIMNDTFYWVWRSRNSIQVLF